MGSRSISTNVVVLTVVPKVLHRNPKDAFEFTVTERLLLQRSQLLKAAIVLRSVHCSSALQLFVHAQDLNFCDCKAYLRHFSSGGRLFSRKIVDLQTAKIQSKQQRRAECRPPVSMTKLVCCTATFRIFDYQVRHKYIRFRVCLMHNWYFKLPRCIETNQLSESGDCLPQ